MGGVKLHHFWIAAGVAAVGMGTVPRSLAKILDYKPLAVEVLPNDQLVIQGFEGRVKLIGQPGEEGAKGLVIRLQKEENPTKISSEAQAVLDEWHFSLQRKGNRLEGVIRSPQSKQTWSQLLMSGGIPQFYMEITSPSIPVEVTWRRGKVVIENWNAPLKAHVLQGEVQVVGGSGEARVVHQQGALTVSGREGHVVVESFKGNVSVDQVKGRVDLKNFSGSTRVNAVDGSLNLTSASGALKVTDCSGRLNFNNLGASVTISGFSGELRGRSGVGAVRAALKGKADVRIRSKEGSVSLRLPHSGAKVNLGTREGSMALPKHLRVSRLPSLRWVKGWLRGEEKGGSVYVRTTEGNIRLR